MLRKFFSYSQRDKGVRIGCLRNDRNWNRNYFWHYPKQNICFGLFRFYTETESFCVLIEPKQTEEPKQFDREHILVLFRKYRVVSVCFEKVLFVSVVLIKVRNTKTNRDFWFLVS
jgi:hypothetical protein